MEFNDDEPILIVYRTNGLIWAAFAQYRDGTEEPSDIFGSEDQMLADALATLPSRIEYRPQELGCESSDDELAVIPRLAAAYDARIARNHRIATRRWPTE